jgi:hypothetical protein
MVSDRDAVGEIQPMARGDHTSCAQFQRGLRRIHDLGIRNGVEDIEPQDGRIVSNLDPPTAPEYVEMTDTDGLSDFQFIDMNEQVEMPNTGVPPDPTPLHADKQAQPDADPRADLITQEPPIDPGLPPWREQGQAYCQRPSPKVLHLDDPWRRSLLSTSHVVKVRRAPLEDVEPYLTGYP